MHKLLTAIARISKIEGLVVTDTNERSTKWPEEFVKQLPGGVDWAFEGWSWDTVKKAWILRFSSNLGRVNLITKEGVMGYVVAYAEVHSTLFEKHDKQEVPLNANRKTLLDIIERAARRAGDEWSDAKINQLFKWVHIHYGEGKNFHFMPGYTAKGQTYGVVKHAAIFAPTRGEKYFYTDVIAPLVKVGYIIDKQYSNEEDEVIYSIGW